MNDHGTSASAILGALVGDALGVPFEFKYANDIPAHDQIRMVMPDEFKKSHYRIGYGTWSDDGSQMLCLLQSLIDTTEFTPESFSELLLKWNRSALHQSGGNVFDCGIQTSYALERLGRGVPPLRSGSDEREHNGNGSLMRSVPIAAVGFQRKYSVEQIVYISHTQSRVTHGHPLSMVCCALYSLIALDLLNSPSKDIHLCLQEAITKLLEIYTSRGEVKNVDALIEIEQYPGENNLRGSGYVVDTLWTSIDCIEKSTSYMDAVRMAIRYGNDTDTTACVTGGLAGIKYGIDANNHNENPVGIPADWIASLDVPEESGELLSRIDSKLFQH